MALRFSPRAEHVRTARLVAVSVARRAGFAEEQLDEIRVAIGEACAQAVATDDLAASGEPVGLVDMRLRDDDDRLDVTVFQYGRDGLPTTAPSGVAPESDSFSLALLAGMADASRSAFNGGLVLSWTRHPAGVPTS
ncbi:MAG: ATP-binding protein [Janthinobacterium lividum]